MSTYGISPALVGAGRPIKSMNQRERKAYMAYVRSFKRKRTSKSTGGSIFSKLKDRFQNSKLGKYIHNHSSEIKQGLEKINNIAQQTQFASNALQHMGNPKAQALGQLLANRGYGRIRRRRR